MMGKLLAAAGCMFVVACAMGDKKTAAQAPASAPPTTGPDVIAGETGIERKARLNELYDDVEAKRQQMQLQEPPEFSCEGDACSKPTPMALQPHPTKSTDAACHPSNTETCNASCTLSDSICTNADKICKLADELAPDNDAAAKCEKATKTCTKAHESCCSCL